MGCGRGRCQRPVQLQLWRCWSGEVDINMARSILDGESGEENTSMIATNGERAWRKCFQENSWTSMAYGRGRKKPRSVSSDGDVGVGGGDMKIHPHIFLWRSGEENNNFRRRMERGVGGRCSKNGA